MNARKLIANVCFLVLFAGFLWALGCASIIGADEYKVASGTTGGGPTGGATTAGATTGGTSSTTGSGCLADTTECSATPGNCCSGVCFSNPRDTTDARFCAPSCTVGSDCASGCCAMMTDRKSCAPKGFCPDTCIDLGDPCDHPAECCAGSWCVTDGTDTACVPLCQLQSDCAPFGFNCCKLNNSATKVCLPPELCPGPTPP